MARYANFGGPIITMVVGAIIYFAVNYNFSGFDLKNAGLILLGAGILWLIIEALRGMSSRKAVHSETAVHTDAAGRTATTERETAARLD